MGFDGFGEFWWDLMDLVSSDGFWWVLMGSDDSIKEAMNQKLKLDHPGLRCHRRDTSAPGASPTTDTTCPVLCRSNSFASGWWKGHYSQSLGSPPHPPSNYACPCRWYSSEKHSKTEPVFLPSALTDCWCPCWGFDASSRVWRSVEPHSPAGRLAGPLALSRQRKTRMKTFFKMFFLVPRKCRKKQSSYVIKNEPVKNNNCSAHTGIYKVTQWKCSKLLYESVFLRRLWKWFSGSFIYRLQAVEQWGVMTYQMASKYLPRSR